nr:uncharacterized protein LOC105476882 isoform X1 [Macaca nemestrina]XP_024647102.1 uncharacterized protein LOC105476882 isoform X1 [Macaca nemestrina]XP_024647108.1 uncharacterized protein LOC105476882 isoform X1 [Macaca nemestrina]XP_024647110.1 uncharacterized protein LOC105476882 isoform X1 [Macaca nemestrina]XP_024647112.1 uncharacterized protein LOC105476882 isoform X1 [Macaca nemestrina]XP_024647113.1 uncharacterized protein LOC105476882 isoform X1 [Macaca nemestrina]
MDMVEDADTLEEREDIIMKYEKVQVSLLLGRRPLPMHPGQRVLGSLGAQGGHGWPLPTGPCTLYLGPLTKVASGLQGHRAGLPEDMGPEPVGIYNNIDHFGILHETKLPPVSAREVKQMRREMRRMSKWMKMLGQWETYKNSKKLMKRVYKGIPMNVRMQVWSVLLNIQEIKVKNPRKFQEGLCAQGSSFGWLLQMLNDQPNPSKGPQQPGLCRLHMAGRPSARGQADPSWPTSPVPAAHLVSFPATGTWSFDTLSWWGCPGRHLPCGHSGCAQPGPGSGRTSGFLEIPGVELDAPNPDGRGCRGPLVPPLFQTELLGPWLF